MAFFDNIGANLKSLFESKFKKGLYTDLKFNDDSLEYIYEKNGILHSQVYNYTDIIEMIKAEGGDINSIETLVPLTKHPREFGIIVMCYDHKVFNMYPHNLYVVLREYNKAMG